MSKLTLFAVANGSNVDRDNGILRGASIISKGPAKGHTVLGKQLMVDDKTLDQVNSEAQTFADGIPVNFDHGTGISDLVGSIRNVSRDGDKVRGDIHLLKSHDFFDSIMEMAETMPSNFGLSISFQNEPEPVYGTDLPTDEDEDGNGQMDVGPSGTVIGEDDVPDDRVTGNDIVAYAARIVPGQLYGADLVKNPATNMALFSAQGIEIETIMSEPAIIEEAKKVEETIVGEIKHIAEEISEAVVGKKQDSGVPATDPVTPEPAVAPVTPAPVENLSAIQADEVVTKLSAINTQFESTRIELAAARSEITDLSAKIAAKDAELSHLRIVHLAAKRALGLAPAEIVPEIEQADVPSLFEQYEALPKGSAERIKFFEANRDRLFEAVNGKSRK